MLYVACYMLHVMCYMLYVIYNNDIIIVKYFTSHSR